MYFCGEKNPPYWREKRIFEFKVCAQIRTTFQREGLNVNA